MSSPFAFWKWRNDTTAGFTDDARFTMARRHLGPITLYRYSVGLPARGSAEKGLTLVWWMLCPWDGVSFGAHLPRAVGNVLSRALFRDGVQEGTAP